MFIVDTSYFIGPNNFVLVKDFITQIADKLALYNDQSRVAIMTFSGGVKVERYLNEPSDREDVMATIDALRYEGDYPFTADALEVMVDDVFTHRHGDRREAQNFAVLITAGQLFSEFQLPVKRRPEEDGIHVFGIGIGLKEGDAEEMNELVSSPDDLYLEEDAERLNSMVDNIVSKLCEGQTNPATHKVVT